MDLRFRLFLLSVLLIASCRAFAEPALLPVVQVQLGAHSCEKEIAGMAAVVVGADPTDETRGAASRAPAMPAGDWPDDGVGATAPQGTECKFGE